MDMLAQLSLAGLVPVIKIKNALDAVPLCQALKNGGLPVAEITFRTDAAEEAIARVHEALPDILLGAGTVLTCEQADRAWKAGAGYIVSPGLNPTVVAHCVEKGYPVLPGCANPSDIETAISFGLKTVKLFPAEALGGLKLIKAMSAPYGDIHFVPTGGINEKNLGDYLAFSKIAACGGSWMVPEEDVTNQRWEHVEELTRNAVNTMLNLRLVHIGINAGTEENALRQAKLFASLLNLNVKDAPTSYFVGNQSGNSVEVMKVPFLGKNGHIAVATPNVERARWHLEQKGFAFDEATATYLPDGSMKLIYLRDEIADFAVHLVKG